MHTLTIAIPTYNRDKILSENIGVLEKIVALNLAIDVKILVVDNGSSETSIPKNKYFEYKKNKFNIGLNGSLLRIIEYVDSDYLWILGDDDYLDEVLITDLIDVIINNNPDWLILSQSDTTLEKKEYDTVDKLLDSGIDFQDLIFISTNIYRTDLLKNNMAYVYNENNKHMPHFLSITESNKINKIIRCGYNPFKKIGMEKDLANRWPPIMLWTGSIFDYIYNNNSNVSYKSRLNFLKNIRKNWLTNKNLMWSMYLIKDQKNKSKYMIYKKISSYIGIIDGPLVGICTRFILLMSILMPNFLKYLAVKINKINR